MPQLWRIYIYQRYRDGASIEQLHRECGIPAEELKLHLEAARLCFERQCAFVPFAAEIEALAMAN